MAQDFGSPVPPISQPKRNNTVLIIVIVVAVLLCCCCAVLVGGWQFLSPTLIEIWNTYSLSLQPLLAGLF